MRGGPSYGRNGSSERRPRLAHLPESDHQQECAAGRKHRPGTVRATAQQVQATVGRGNDPADEQKDPDGQESNFPTPVGVMGVGQSGDS